MHKTAEIARLQQQERKQAANARPARAHFWPTRTTHMVTSACITHASHSEHLQQTTRARRSASLLRRHPSPALSCSARPLAEEAPTLARVRHHKNRAREARAWAHARAADDEEMRQHKNPTGARSREGETPRRHHSRARALPRQIPAPLLGRTLLVERRYCAYSMTKS